MRSCARAEARAIGSEGGEGGEGGRGRRGRRGRTVCFDLGRSILHQLLGLLEPQPRKGTHLLDQLDCKGRWAGGAQRGSHGADDAACWQGWGEVGWGGRRRSGRSQQPVPWRGAIHGRRAAAGPATRVRMCQPCRESPGSTCMGVCMHAAPWAARGGLTLGSRIERIEFDGEVRLLGSSGCRLLGWRSGCPATPAASTTRWHHHGTRDS